VGHWIGSGHDLVIVPFLFQAIWGCTVPALPIAETYAALHFFTLFGKLVSDR
jgi:hypothetical protein